MADIVVHPKVFLIFAAAGMLGGLLYAVIRGLQGSKRRPVWTGILDLLFCFSIVVLFGVCTAYSLSGQIRLFGVAAFATGFAVFYAGPGVALRRTISRMIAFVARQARRASFALNQMLAKHKSDE